MAVVKLAESELWFRKGQASFLRGDLIPEDKWTQKEWGKPLNNERCFYLGYFRARAMKIMGEQKTQKREEMVRNYIKYGYDLPDDFNRN